MMFDRMNNRTVPQIIAEFDKVAAMPIASGEVEGIKYSLYNVPKDGNSVNKNM